MENAMTSSHLSHAEIKQALGQQLLFDNKTWRLSPEAWPLSEQQVAAIEEIGKACLEFHHALDILYMRSVEDRNLLRNKPLKAPWIAGYLDRGKPAQLIEHSRLKRLRGKMPVVIRPDLLLTENGFSVTEIDSVPGGIGLTAYLNRLYERNGTDIIGAGDSMIHAFYDSLAALTPDKPLPLIAILVSDEAATYRPEMQWLAATLQRLGKRVYCFHPSEVMPLGTALCGSVDGNPEQIDIIYRFWELFDLSNVPIANFILEAWEESQLVVTPPMRPFQEEKLALALFHHHLLEDFWREQLSKKSWQLLHDCIPMSWIIDPVDLPPNAVLHAPNVGGHPIHRWQQLGDASKKERNFIMKLSGFHKDAWGARSVLLGSDASSVQWRKGIEDALEISKTNLYILQDYHKPLRTSHPVYSDSDTVKAMQGRLRLCPYFFVKDNEARLTGILATFCPADKKIIHGMRDAAMLPCRVERQPKAES